VRAWNPEKVSILAGLRGFTSPVWDKKEFILRSRWGRKTLTPGVQQQTSQSAGLCCEEERKTLLKSFFFTHALHQLPHDSDSSSQIPAESWPHTLPG